MKQIKFRMTAFSDAAGKYNPDAIRDGNEDNWYVDDDLGDETPGCCSHDKEVALSDCGMLMVVADGMGGMNAGEVASELAVRTVEEYFAPGRITPKMASSMASRQKYMEEVIVEADARIKKDAAVNREHGGMGSTIIIAWLVGDELTVSWCGDSRAYRFNPRSGLEMLSEDHSYVQDLVKQGTITYEDTFGHVNGNVITRSLGDPVKKAQPETRHFRVYNSDIILLCSDGLSGVLFDREARRETGELISPENLEDIIRANRYSLQGCREALMQAAERNDWYDNVTVILCEILDGAGEAPDKSDPVLLSAKTGEETALPGIPEGARHAVRCHKGWWAAIGIVLMLVCFAAGVWCGQYEVIRGMLDKPSIDSVQMNRKAKLINMIVPELKELRQAFYDLNNSISAWDDTTWNTRYDLFEAKFGVLRQITREMLSNKELNEFQQKVYQAQQIDTTWKDKLESLIEKYEKEQQQGHTDAENANHKNGIKSSSKPKAGTIKQETGKESGKTPGLIEVKKDTLKTNTPPTKGGK